MPKLKVLSGKDLVKIFILFGFEILSQKGSHIKLCRIIWRVKSGVSCAKSSWVRRGNFKGDI